MFSFINYALNIYFSVLKIFKKIRGFGCYQNVGADC